MQNSGSKNPEHPKFTLRRARAEIERILPQEHLDLSEITTEDADLIAFFKKYFKGESEDFSKMEMSLKVFKLHPPVEKDGVSLEYSLERIDCSSSFTETFFRDKNRNWQAHSEFVERENTAKIIPFPRKTTSKS